MTDKTDVEFCLGLWWNLSLNLNIVGFRQFVQIQNMMDFQTHLRQIPIQLSFWKAFFHRSLQSTISDTKVNNYALNSYLLMSI